MTLEEISEISRRVFFNLIVKPNPQKNMYWRFYGGQYWHEMGDLADHAEDPSLEFLA